MFVVSGQSEMEHSSPVLICGHGNSGTTLLLALLDRHPELLVFPEETRFFKRILGYPDRRNVDCALTYTGAKAFRLRQLGDRQGYRDYSSLDFAEYALSLRRRWDSSDGSERALLESIVLAYGETTRQINRKYWVEKTPGNEVFLDQARAAWPDLRAIYMIRDPRSVYCSIRKSRSAISKALALEEFIVHWLTSICAWERFADRSPNGLLIRYDDLVQKPQYEMQRVCEFLQIRWDDILLRPTRNGVDWSGNSMYNMAFSGISAEPLQRYRGLLTPDETRFLEVWLGRVMARYGWQPEHGSISMSGLARELLAGGSGSPVLKLRMLRALLRLRSPLS